MYSHLAEESLKVKMFCFVGASSAHHGTMTAAQSCWPRCGQQLEGSYASAWVEEVKVGQQQTPKDLEKHLLNLKLALHIYICQLSCIMNYVCHMIHSSGHSNLYRFFPGVRALIGFD